MTNITLITEQDRTACSVNSKSHPEKVHPQFYFEWTGKRGNCLHCSQYGESATLLLLNVVCLDTIFPKVCKKFCLCFYLWNKSGWIFLVFYPPLFHLFFFYRQGILFWAEQALIKNIKLLNSFLRHFSYSNTNILHKMFRRYFPSLC